MKTIDYSVEAKAGINPQAASAGTITGSAIDRKDFDDGRIVGQVGAVAGAPSAQSVIFKLTESDASGGTYTDVTGGAIAAVTTDNQIVDLEIPDMHKRKRYFKLVAVVAFTGGSSPAIPINGILELGKKDQEPVA